MIVLFGFFLILTLLNLQSGTSNFWILMLFAFTATPVVIIMTDTASEDALTAIATELFNNSHACYDFDPHQRIRLKKPITDNKVFIGKETDSLVHEIVLYGCDKYGKVKKIEGLVGKKRKTVIDNDFFCVRNISNRKDFLFIIAFHKYIHRKLVSFDINAKTATYHTDSLLTTKLFEIYPVV